MASRHLLFTALLCFPGSLGLKVPISSSKIVRRSAVATNAAPIENAATVGKFDQLQPRSNPEVLDFPRRDYFYGRVSIELGEGYKTMVEDFGPSWKDDQCSLAPVEASLPLGMVIEESENLPGRFEISEVREGSNAEKAGVKVGDILRAVTAQKKDAMAAAEGNIAFNAVAGATTAGVVVKKALFNADRQSFEAVMNALGTNSDQKGGTGRVSMIFERRYTDAEA